MKKRGGNLDNDKAKYYKMKLRYWLLDLEKKNIRLYSLLKKVGWIVKTNLFVYWLVLGLFPSIYISFLTSSPLWLLLVLFVTVLLPITLFFQT